jgi:hypothetical protein
MNFDTDRTLLSVGMFEPSRYHPLTPSRFTWIETKQRALDAQDGDLFREPLLELELEGFLVHALLPVVVVSAHEKFYVLR